jgi:hypothetical protein
MQQPTRSQLMQPHCKGAGTQFRVAVLLPHQLLRWGDSCCVLRVMVAQVAAPSYSVADYWASFQPSPRHEAIAKTSPDVFGALPKAYDTRYPGGSTRPLHAAIS